MMSPGPSIHSSRENVYSCGPTGTSAYQLLSYTIAAHNEAAR